MKPPDAVPLPLPVSGHEVADLSSFISIPGFCRDEDTSGAERGLGCLVLGLIGQAAAVGAKCKPPICRGCEYGQV